MDTIRVEGLSGEVDDNPTYLIVVCDDKTSIYVVYCVMHSKVLQATIIFLLKVRGLTL